MLISRGNNRKDSKNKMQIFHGEKLLGPQASLRVTPCPQAPNHTRGEAIRPPSQIKNNSCSVIRTHGLDDLSFTRCAPTITSRPSGNCIIVSVKSFEIPRWGRGLGGLSDWECNQAFPVNNKGNKSYQELRTHLLYKHSLYFMFPFHQNSFVIINQQRFVMMAAVLVNERNITNFLFARKTFHPKYIYYIPNKEA